MKQDRNISNQRGSTVIINKLRLTLEILSLKL